MHEVYVAGAAMTQFGKFPDATIRTLAEEATNGALDDAGITAADIGMVFFSNAVAGLLTNQEMIRGQVALRHTGLLGVPMVNVENACASASSAFYLACMAVGSGAADVALAIGSEKLTHEDRARSFAAIGTAVDQQQVAELRQWASSGSAGSPLPGQADSLPAEAGGGSAGLGRPDGKRSFFMDIYAASSRAYMKRSGATRQDFAEVAVKSHRHAALNPHAQYRTEVTVEDVLTSREIAPPLTLLMCSPIGDGAAALVVCSPEAARRLGARVRVQACALVSGRDQGPGEPNAVERASRTAYEHAGVGPGDLDVVELHDAAAPAELITYEELGLCGEGEGPALLASGATRLGGRIPVNPSGGLLSKGHPIGATGCAQLVELTDQLRGRCGQRQVAGAQLALAQNGGGFLGSDAAAMVVTVLSTLDESEAGMEFKQVVGNRRTIRFFDPNRPVEEEKIQVMLEAANRASRAVNADFAKAIVCYRDELSDEVRAQMKTPTTTVQIDLAPVTIFWYGDTSFVNGAQGRLKELVDLGALPVTHGWTHAYVDELVYPQVLEPMSKDQLATVWAVSVETGLAIAQAMLAGVDEGLGVGLHAFNAAAVKDVLKVPDHWVPMWILLVGYPAEDAKGGGQRPRRALSDSFYRGQYGSPWQEVPGVTDRLKREGMIQEPMAADATQRMAEIKQLADRFGLPL